MPRKLSAAALICLMATPALAQITPPPGPVGPTFKTLDQAEPRIPLSIANTPGDANSVFRIVEPGSYYLTGTLHGKPGKHGIEIAASDVTIDLMGYSVVGEDLGLTGITLESAADRVTLRNGTVTGWTENGVNLSAGGEGRVIEHIQVSVNGYRGIITGNTALISNCSATSNGGDGIIAGNASVVENANAKLNGGTGILILQGSVGRGCSAYENTFGGYYIEQGGALESSAALKNERAGITARNGTRITDCVARENIGDGINAGDESIITGCTSSRNEGDGIESDGNSIIRNNVCSFNLTPNGDGAGIRITEHGSRLEDNHVRVNDFGIKVEHTHNFIVKNTAISNTTNYRIVSSNRVGLIVAAPSSDSIDGNSGGGLNTTRPWANFAY